MHYVHISTLYRLTTLMFICQTVNCDRFLETLFCTPKVIWERKVGRIRKGIRAGIRTQQRQHCSPKRLTASTISFFWGGGGVRCLAQGHLGRGIVVGESAGYSLTPPPTIPASPRLDLATGESDSLTLGHDFPNKYFQQF